VTCVYVNPETDQFWLIDYRIYDPEGATMLLLFLIRASRLVDERPARLVNIRRRSPPVIVLLH
jgi:hypothetical protein